MREDVTAGWTKLDRSVKPVESFTAARRRPLSGYANLSQRPWSLPPDRNHPEVEGTSRLSPYLHFGNIGPITIALAVKRPCKQGKVPAGSARPYLEQMIGWRELAVLFVKYNPNYDSWECAEPWARQTLIEHAGDERPYRYTLPQLERAETHDDLWNAAQREMTADWLDAQLHAHVLGQEDPRLVPRPGQGIRYLRHAE